MRANGLKIPNQRPKAKILAEACDLGFQESLALLKLLVEAQIPDQM